ncbi:PDZ domain-containing protein [Arachnia propionica]|uniref:YlbL family protein n=1 Tax=Arachnia propionica TaxID=1750 RepID=UPI0021AB31DC|nr:PDZ domain-containing protein [Arachnia propionica]MDO5083521.1 PDZ domain-containing protein [Arachnia propionica]
MSRNLVAVVSSVLFVVFAVAIVLIPVPFVTWRPGQTVDVLGGTEEGPLIEISGLPVSSSGGTLLMTTVSTTRVDSNVSLPEALIAHVAEDSDALPREILYPAGKSYEEVQSEAVALMDTSRGNATVAALRAAGQTVTEMPMIAAVTLSGPANGVLQPGDLVEAIDDTPVSRREDIQDAIRRRGVGEPVVFRVIRGGDILSLTVTTVQGTDGHPSIGIRITTGYRYAPTVTYRIDPVIVGPSAGLVFALAVYDRITDGVLPEGAVVAGTGAIDAAGKVSAIGGVREKIKGAEKAGATIFLMPRANCQDLGVLNTSIRLVPVTTLKDAIAALQLLEEGKTDEEVPTCG